MKQLLSIVLLFVNSIFPVDEPVEANPSTNPITATQTEYSIEEFSSTKLLYTVAEGTQPVVTFTTSDASIATVSEMGVVNGLKEGNATITLSAKVGDESFDTLFNVSVFSVTGTLTFKYNEVFVHRGTSYHLEYTLSNPLLENKDIVWTSSDPAIVEVENGVIKGIAKGSAVVTAIIGESRSSINVDVIVPLQEIAFNPGSISITLDESHEIPELIYVPYDTSSRQNPKYESEDSKIAEIVEGSIVARKIGKTRIIARIDEVEAFLDIEVLPKESEAGAVMISLLPIEETNSFVKFGFDDDTLSSLKRVALTLDSDSLKKAVTEGKNIIVCVPQRYLDENMRFVEYITVLKDSLVENTDSTFITIIDEEKSEPKISFLINGPLTHDLNLKYRIQKIANSSPYAKMIDGRAFEVRFFNETPPTNVKARISAKEIDSTPQQHHFLYIIENDSKLSSVVQSGKMSDEETLEINVDNDHFLLTFNAVSKSSDQGVIWVLGGVVTLIIVLGGVFYAKGKRKTKKDVL